MSKTVCVHCVIQLSYFLINYLDFKLLFLDQQGITHNYVVVSVTDFKVSNLQSNPVEISLLLCRFKLTGIPGY